MRAARTALIHAWVLHAAIASLHSSPPGAQAARGAFSAEQATRALAVRGFVSAAGSLCPRRGARLKLLVLVSSRPARVANRNAIRSTWARFSDQKAVSIGFLVGQPSSATEAKAILAEETLDRDLIIARFAESANSSSLRTLAMLEWITEHCPKVKRFMRASDTVFVNVPRLLSFVDRTLEDKRTIWGRMYPHDPTYTLREGSYNILRGVKRYPNFAIGHSYLVSGDLVSPLLRAALDQPYVPKEDVFVTGLVAHALAARKVNYRQFCRNNADMNACKLQSAISVQDVAVEQQSALMTMLLKNECNRTV